MENGNKKAFDPSCLFRATSNAQYCWNLLFPTLAKGQAVTMQQLIDAWQKVIDGYNATGKKLATTGNTQSAQARANEYRNWAIRTGTWKRAEDCPGYVLGSRFDNVTIKGKSKSKGKGKSKVKVNAPTTSTVIYEEQEREARQGNVNENNENNVNN